MEELNAATAPHRWTESEMYVQNQGCESLGLRRTTPAFKAALTEETYWERVEELPTLSPEQDKAVNLDGMICPLCTGYGNVLLQHRGETTGIEIPRSVACACQRNRRFWREFGTTVDSRFIDADLDTLEPSGKVVTPIARQEKLHAALKAHPDASMLFTGPSGGGKTYLMACLYRHAVQQAIEEQRAANDLCESVWWTAASVMLNEHVAWEITSDKDDKTDPRYVTEAKIQRAAKHGWKPRLYIDELDKWAVSSFKGGRLYEVINSCYRAGGVVCATMNKSSEEFAKMLQDRDLAESITRRIGADGGFIVCVP
jgi:hypothetical protein